jgi:hypothetical protein
MSNSNRQGLGSRIHAHFAHLGGVELEAFEADQEREIKLRRDLAVQVQRERFSSSGGVTTLR